MNFSWGLLSIIGISAGLLAGQAQAGTCELVWKVTRSGEYSARFTAPVASDWTHDRLPEPIRDATSSSLNSATTAQGAIFDARGLLPDPEKRVGSAVLEWLKSRIVSASPGACNNLRIELRTEWRYQYVPSDSVHRYPKDVGPETARLRIQRLSSARDHESKREYFGVEIEAVASTSADSRTDELQSWLTGIFHETDLREPGVAWNDRPLEINFPSGPRADIGFVAGSYAPAGEASFGTGVHCAISSESSLSDTFIWKTNYLGTRAVFGQGNPKNKDTIGLSILDFHATTGIHWRPKVHANDAYVAGIRNFVGISITTGIHRVFSKTNQPHSVNQAFTAPSVDLGLDWGAFNRKRNLLVGLEFHILNYLTTTSFSPIYEFGIRISMQ